MAEINLIKAVIEEKAQKKRESARTSSVIVFLVLFLIVISVLILGGRFLLARENNNLDSKITAAENEAKEAEEIENNIDLLNSDYSKIKAVDKTNRDWTDVFSEVAAATPAEIQLSKIDYAGTASTSAAKKAVQENKIKITGIARGRRAVSVFQEKLQKNTEVFSSVEIIKVGTVTQNEAPTITFEVDATLKKI